MSTEFIIGLLILLGVASIKVIILVRRWQRNNAQPEICSQVRVAAKLKDPMFASRRNPLAGKVIRILFEFADSGEKREIEVPINESRLIAEGDSGELTLQGTRYIRFKKQ